MSETTGLNRPDWERWPGAPCQPNDVDLQHTNTPVHCTQNPGLGSSQSDKTEKLHLTQLFSLVMLS